nr:MAG TPA: hypothetical protein [Caudoviricetes sp.]
MLSLGVKNTTAQSVVSGGLVNLGSVYRKNCCKNACGVKTFDFDGNSINLQQSGIYTVTALVTFTAPAAGNVVLQLTDNGVVIPGAIATETITTATTEVKTTTIQYQLLVDSTCVLGQYSTQVKNISLLNSGVASTISNVVVNVVKTR